MTRISHQYNTKYGIVVLFLLWLFAAGCASTEEAAVPDAEPFASPAQYALLDRVLWKSAPDPDRALELYIAGSLLEEQGDFESALEMYNQALLYDDDATILSSLAGAHIHTGNSLAALVYATEAVKRAPGKTEYRRQLAQLYMLNGETDSAAGHLQKIIEQDPSDVQARYSLAQMYDEGDPERALEMYETLRQRMGDDWNLATRMAELYSQLGRLPEAAQALETLLRLDSDNAVVMQTLANLYIRIGQYDRALELYETLTVQAPGNVSYRLGTAEIYLHKNNWDAASKAMRSALESPGIRDEDAMRIGEIYFQQAVAAPTRSVEALDVMVLLNRKYPDRWKPSWYLGALMFNTGQYEQSVPHFRRALDMDPGNLQTLDVLSRASMALGNYEEAATTLNRIAELGEATAEIYSQLGFAYQQLGRNDDAIRALQQALELKPGSMETLTTLALLYDGRKEFEKSKRLYENAIALYEDGSAPRDDAYYIMLNNYAYALSERGEQLDRALQLAEQAMEKQPENSSFLDTVGWVHFQSGDFLQAREYIEKAIAARQKQGIEPGPVLYDHLGDVYFKLGQNDKAHRYWEKALSLEPDNQDVKRKLD